MRERWDIHTHATLSAPAAPQTTVQSISYFRGCDLGHTPPAVDMTRSPDSLNMLRDGLGQLRKRMGYHTVRTYPGRINGAYSFFGHEIIHAGTHIYCDGEEIGDAADEISSARLLGDVLWLLDGTCLRRIERQGGGIAVTPAENAAYIPTVIISRDPDGGGTTYEAYNLIGRGFRNSFCGAAGKTVYRLTDSGLDSDPVTARHLASDGTWRELSEGTDFSVERTTGTVTFVSAPGASPVEGEDNLVITAYKTRDGYTDRINHCTICTLYGVNGAADRLFVTGNPDYPGRDWFSAQGSAAMLGDLSYSVLGQGDAAITGYSVVSDRLAAHKSGADDGRNIVLRYGQLDSDGAAVFPIVAALQGEAAIAPAAFARLEGEPLFLTRRGVYAITASDLTGERYSQCRSAFLNARITAEDNPAAACACVHGGFYFLCLNSRVYALDSLQKSYNDGEPYSSYQYEGYCLDNIPARVMWESGDTLCFGTADGRVACFYTDRGALASYNDDGAAIRAYWDTPYIAGARRYTKKDYRYLAVTLAPHSATSLTVYALRDGLWQRLFCDESSARYLDFANMDFSRFSFSTDTGPKNIRRRIAVRGADKIMLRLENDRPDEPLSLVLSLSNIMSKNHMVAA